MIAIEITLSIFLGVTFLLSSIPKIRRPRGFVLVVLEYRVLPPLLGKIFGWLLPPSELFLALLLISGTDIGVTSIIVSLLLCSFIIAISSNIARGRDLNCGCFGLDKQRKIGWPLLLQDIALLGITIVLSKVSTDWIGLASWSLFRYLFPAYLENYLIPVVCLIITIFAILLLRRRSVLSLRQQRVL